MITSNVISECQKQCLKNKREHLSKFGKGKINGQMYGKSWWLIVCSSQNRNSFKSPVTPLNLSYSLCKRSSKRFNEELTYAWHTRILSMTRMLLVKHFFKSLTKWVSKFVTTICLTANGLNELCLYVIKNICCCLCRVEYVLKPLKVQTQFNRKEC